MSPHTTLSEAFELYRSEVVVFKNQSRHTEEQLNQGLKLMLRFIGKDIIVEEVDFEIIRRWKLEMDSYLSPNTIRIYLIKLRLVLEYMKAKGLDVLSPDSIALPRKVVKVPKALPASDVQKLIDYTLFIRSKTIISLLYSTGLRVSELCSLDRSDVKEDYFTTMGKGGKPRVCYIDARTRKMLDLYLRRRIDGEPALFLSSHTKKRVTPQNIQVVFRIASAKAGLGFPISPHTMRHSFATNLMKNGAHLRAIQMLLGHNSLETTQIYLTLYDAELAEAHQKYHSV